MVEDVRGHRPPPARKPETEAKLAFLTPSEHGAEPPPINPRFSWIAR